MLALSPLFMNKIDCSQTPDCSLLNRLSCSKIINTCGQCQEGFIGDEGDRNTKCIDPISSISLFNTSIYPHCIVDEECKLWEICDVAFTTCFHQAKICDNNCYGHGFCYYIDVNTDKSVSLCLLGDDSCKTNCICDDDYFGSVCSLNRVDLEYNQHIRSNLINKQLLNLTNLEDESPETIKAWLSYLVEITRNSYELSGNKELFSLIYSF
jgi:hypothetical protein